MLVVLRIVAVAVMTALAMPAHAQSPFVAKWEVEIHGGAATSSTSTSGTNHLPPTGTIQTMTVFVNGQPQRVDTRLVPSWFFGDGPVLLNQVFSPPPDFRIAPLDPLLSKSIIAAHSGGSIGFRVARRLAPRFSAEFSFDRNMHTLGLSSDAAQQIEASRASFEKMWNAIVTLFGPNASATAAATLTGQGGRQSVMSGTLLVDIGGGRNVLPYVAVGAGVINTEGPLPSAQLIGDYHFRVPFPPGFPLPPSASPEFHEIDTVTISGSIAKAPAAVVGAGGRIAMSRNAGIRVDIRDHVSRNARTTIVDAAPMFVPAAPGTLASFVLLGSNPVVQISNAANAPSTLSDKSVTAFETFHAHGVSNQVNLSVGLYWRF